MFSHRRRALLRTALGAAVLGPTLAACDLFSPDPPPPPDPLTDFYNETLALAALYDAQAARVSSATANATLLAIRDAHRAHAGALAAIMFPAPPSPSGAPPLPSAAPSPEPLRETERTAWQKAVEACVAAPAERAQLLGEIASARATHVEVLT